MNIDHREIRVDGRLIRVGRLDADGFHRLENPAFFIETARKTFTGVDLVTFAQTLPHTQPECDFHMEWDNVAALPVTTFDQWWTAQIDNKTRNMARKGEKKGLIVKEVAFDDRLVEGIRDVYNETPIRQGKRFWHYGKPLDVVKRENGTFRDDSVFIGAFLNDRLVGFVKLVIDRGGGQASMMQILSMLKHRDVAPTNALIAQAVRSCAQRTIPYLVYAHFAYGNKTRDSLVTFKLNNGFRRIDVPRYFIPVTRRGRLALSLGLHRPFRERVPESLLAGYRELRALWHARRVPQP